MAEFQKAKAPSCIFGGDFIAVPSVGFDDALLEETCNGFKKMKLLQRHRYIIKIFVNFVNKTYIRLYFVKTTIRFKSSQEMLEK